MGRVYERDGLTLTEGDSREVLPGFANESFDFVLTDPPYGLNKVYGRSELGHRACVGDEDSQLALWVWGEISRLLRQDRWAAVFCGWSTLGDTLQAAAENGMSVKTVIAWDKVLPGLGQGIRNQYELVVLARKGKPKDHYKAGNVWRISRERGRPIHPNQKPIELLQRLLIYYGNGGSVLDPFAGSASTLVAAYGLGLEATGIEVGGAEWEKAVQRLTELSDVRHTSLHPAQQTGA